MIYSDEPLSIDYNTAHKIAKPPIPYIPGHEFTVVRHHLPPPPPSWARVNLRFKTAREREEVDALTRCLRHPPVEGQLFPREVLRLQILDTIRAGDRKPGQLVTVRILQGCHSGLSMVAKFYDPLYYNHYSDDVDPFLCADREYTREAAAYSHLSDAEVQRISKYYGSYSLKLPVGHDSRFIRLILIEKIDGIPMNKLNPQELSLSQRQVIMKGILDVESQIYKNDVRNLDVHPRNVIVKNAHAPCPGIVIIDFGFAILCRSYDPEDEPEEEQAMLPGTYISPKVRWGIRNATHFLVLNFQKWITWNWNAWLQREYKDDEVDDYMRSQWQPESTDVWPPGCE